MISQNEAGLLRLATIKSSLLVVLSGILYGFIGFLGTKILREQLPLTTMLFWRFFIAGSWMLLFALKSNSRQTFASLDRKAILIIFILGSVGYAGSSAFYFLATPYIGTGLGMVVFFSYPLMISVFSWIKCRESFNLTIFLALISITLGLVLLQDSFYHALRLIGIAWALLAALCYAFYIVGSKRFSALKMDSNILTIIVCYSSAFIFLLFSIHNNNFVLPPTIHCWIYLLAFGILVTALPIQLMLEGLKQISAMRASIISVLEPLVNVFVGVYALNESLTHLQVLGSIIILGSAILVQFHKKL